MVKLFGTVVIQKCVHIIETRCLDMDLRLDSSSLNRFGYFGIVRSWMNRERPKEKKSGRFTAVFELELLPLKLP